MAAEQDTPETSFVPSSEAASPTASPAVAPGHRKPTTGEAQAQRIAWGNQWGQVTRQAGAKTREERAR